MPTISDLERIGRGGHSPPYLDELKEFDGLLVGTAHPTVIESFHGFTGIKVSL